MNTTAENTIPTRESVAACLAMLGQAHPEILRLELFGSVARGEATADSDVDLVATFASALKEQIRGLDFFGYLDDLEAELSDAIGKRVHVTDRAGVECNVRIGNTALARAIARDGQVVYETDQSAERCAGSHR